MTSKDADGRHARLTESHLIQLTRLAQRIRETRPDGDEVPDFDPDSGGVSARVLLLLEAPGPGAVAKGGSRLGSGFVSLDNNDETARNLKNAVETAVLARDEVLMWNIVPWYVGNEQKIRPATSNDIRAAVPWLLELLDLLTELRVVVLLGNNAQRGWLSACSERFIKTPIIPSPHTSRMSVNRNTMRAGQIATALDRARAASR